MTAGRSDGLGGGWTMKTLGGVGAVVFGGMLLLTVRIGPAPSAPETGSPAKLGPDPIAAVAAVPDAPPRSTPAAVAPVRETQWCVVEVGGEKKIVRAKGPQRRTEAPAPPTLDSLDWTWAVSLPSSVCL